MAQINLLSSETKHDSAAVSRVFLTMFMRVLVAILLLLLLLYGYLWLSTRSVASSLQNTQRQIDQVQTTLSADKARNDVLTRQGQIKNLETLIMQHRYWSGTLTQLAQATLSTASYLGITFADDGQASLQVSVPNYAEFDKFLQVFDRPEFNKDFSNVRIRGVSKVEQDNTLQLSFTVGLDYNTNSIRYDTLQGAAAQTK